MELILTKTTSGTLAPSDEEGVNTLAKLKIGEGVKVSIKRVNNVEFHRKLMALLTLGFEIWEPKEQTYKGMVVQKNFDQFRKDITILAGYYEPVINFKGEVRLIAKSLNFSKMGQEERETLFNSVLNVLLKKVMTNYTHADLQNVLNQILAFT